MTVNFNQDYQYQQYDNYQNYNANAQTDRFNNWAQNEDVSLFNEKNIQQANEFLNSHLPDAQGLFDFETLTQRENLMVIKDENGNLLGQMVDSDHDGQVDSIEYYVQDDAGSMIYGTDEEGNHNFFSEYKENEDGTASRAEGTLNEKGEITSFQKTELDADGNKTSVMYDKDGDKKADEVEKYEYKYDEEGNIIREIIKIDSNNDGVFEKKKINQGKNITSKQT